MMSDDLLEAISDLHDEQVERLRTEPRIFSHSYLRTPQERAVEVVGDLLATARNAGWRSLQDGLDECCVNSSDYDQ